MVIQNPCGVCKRSVHGNHRYLICNICQLRVHIGCNFIPVSVYKELKLQNNTDTTENIDNINFNCSSCFNEALPFGHENDNAFYSTNYLGLNHSSNIENFEITLDKTTKTQIKQISQLILENTDPENENSGFCKYYSVEQFKKRKFNHKNNFSIFHLNIASLQYHFEDFQILLSTLDHEFDIISISETKINKNVLPHIDINIPNYQFEHTPSTATKGGTLIYILNKHNYKPRPDLNSQLYESGKVESTFIEIIQPKGKNSVIGSIYKHHTITQSEFTNMIHPLLATISKEKKPCYLSGDFNINLLSINNNPEAERFFDKLTERQFMPLITVPTRIAKTSKTLIDNIFYNQFSNDIVSGNLTVGISDHMPQFCIVPSGKYQSKAKANNTFRRNFKNFNAQQFSDKINSIDWTINDSDDFNEFIPTLINTTEELLDQMAPLSRLTNKQIKQSKKPWINHSILDSIRKKDTIYKKSITETNIILKQQYILDYKKLKNEITKNIRSSKKVYYQAYFLKNSQNTKKMWVGVNSIIHTKSASNFSPNCIEQIVNGNKTTITQPAEMANAFNSHYVSIADKILEKRRYGGCKNFTQYLKNSNPHTFLAKPVTPSEVEIIISSFDTSKSTGPNSIPNKIVKLVSKSVAVPISNISNHSFSTGIHPDILKTQKVIPIHKKDSKLEIVNYRPISLLSNINKIIEKLMFNRLYSFLELHSCIYDLQFGFREKHSTNHALMSMVQQIRDTMDNGNTAVGVFVDFQKAFDTVNHDILIRKLEHYGVRGTPNNWFRSYLFGRKQFVNINNTNSEHLVINHGVPQGSVLGPLLFLIYINDLHTCIRHSTTRHFADDTSLVHVLNKCSPNSTKKLNKDLRSLNHWLLANKISLNSTKTELIYFRKFGSQIPIKYFKLNGVKLLPCSVVKYVGITLDEHLTFEPHRKILHSQLKRANNLLSISRYYVPSEILLQIYFGQFYSRLVYGSQIWGLIDNDNFKILTQQKKAIRKISFSHFEAHSNPLFKNMGLLKLPDIMKINNIIFVHNVLNNKAPAVFQNYFKFKPLHEYDTIRNPNSLYSVPKGSLELPKTNLLVGKKSTKYICANTWNTTLKELARIHPDLANNQNWFKELSVFKLKQLLKNHFLGSY